MSPPWDDQKEPVRHTVLKRFKEEIKPFTVCIIRNNIGSLHRAHKIVLQNGFPLLEKIQRKFEKLLGNWRRGKNKISCLEEVKKKIQLNDPCTNIL